MGDFIDDINSCLIAGGRADSQDARYQLINSEFLTKATLEPYYLWLEMNGLDHQYDNEKFDCDDFAMNFWIWCRILYARQADETKAESPLIGYCKSATQKHALNFAITNHGLTFFDPQVGPVPQPGGIYLMQF